MLVAPSRNLTISETEIGSFEIMAREVIAGKLIKFQNTSQNKGFDTYKCSVKFQTNTMVVSCAATVSRVAH